MMQHIDWWWLFCLLPLLYITAPRTWTDGELVTSAMMNSLRDLFLDIEAGNAFMKRVKLDLLETAEYTTTYLSTATTAALAFVPSVPNRIHQSIGGAWWYPIGGIPMPLGYHSTWLSARGLRPMVPFAGYAAEDKAFGGTAYRAMTGVPFPLGLSVCYWELVLPKGWNPADFLYIEPYWFSPAASSGNVLWNFQILGVSHGESLNQYLNAGGSSADSFLGAEIMHIGPACAFYTAAVKSDFLRLCVYRNSDSAEDTFADTAWLIGAKLYFTINAATDA